MKPGFPQLNRTRAGWSIDHPATIAALILVATVTEAMLLLLPIYIGAISDLLALTQTQVGLVGSADLAGVAIGSTSAVVWLRKVAWRKVTLFALTFMLVANVLSLMFTDIGLLMLLRFSAGLAAGIAYALALAGLCDTSNQARNTALMVCSQVVFGAIGLYVLPLLSDRLRLNGVYLYIIVWAVVTLMTAWLAFPNNPVAHSKKTPLSWSRFGLPGILAFVATGLYFLTIGAVWGYLERIAIEAGMTLADVGSSLSWGYIISLIGSFGAAWLGVKFGRAWPMTITGIVQLAMLVVFTRLNAVNDVMTCFFVANAIFQFFWSFIIAYQIVIFNDADKDGHFMPLYGTAMHAALAVGPFAGAMMISGESYQPILFFGIGTLAMCYLMFLLSVFFERRTHQWGENV
jgi:predicted MFS family arabinose efflux permease